VNDAASQRATIGLRTGGSPRRSRRKWLAHASALVGLGILVAACGGSSASTGTSAPAGQGSADAGAPSSGAQGGSVATLGATLPGVVATDVTQGLQGQGFTCQGPITFLDGVEFSCTGPADGEARQTVDIIGMSPTDVRSVNGSFIWSGAADGFDAAANAFMSGVAALQYTGADPSAAQAWVTSTPKGQTTFGPATFSITTANLSRLLFITGTK
jgi:hypothetical protein